MSRQKEVIVVGGGYNPPTVAHQAIVGACLEQPGFDEVWVMPSRERWDKSIATTDEDRLAMLEAMKEEVFGGDERLHISDFELSMPAPTETIRTVSALAIAHTDTRFWFAFGADSYATMPLWGGGEELQRTLPMLLVERPGYDLPPESDLIRHLQIGVDEAIRHASSSEVRGRIRQNLPVSALVCESVGHYIGEKSLYLEEQDPLQV